jgi:hypothetical protein
MEGRDLVAIFLLQGLDTGLNAALRLGGAKLVRHIDGDGLSHGFSSSFGRQHRKRELRSDLSDRKRLLGRVKDFSRKSQQLNSDASHAFFAWKTRVWIIAAMPQKTKYSI